MIEEKPLSEPAVAGRYSPHSQLRRLDGFDLEIIESPATTLGARSASVLEDLLRLSRENLASDPSSYLPTHFAEATTLIVVRRGGELLGLSMASQLEVDGAHFLWVRQTVLAPGARGAMFMQRVTGVHLWRAVWKAWPRRFFLLTRTANPRVVGSLLAAPQFHPRPNRATPEPIREAARTFCRAQGCLDRLDDQALVLRNAVSQADDEQGPRHHDDRINAFCDERLVSAGDRLLMIARAGLLEATVSTLSTAVRARLGRSRSVATRARL